MKFLFLLFFYFLSCSLSAQKISFVTYGTNEGLPQSQVTSITQDNQGYLWVGTFGGLGRFNGKDFVTYSTKDGLLNNRISFLKVIDEAIWVGHEGGISRIFKNKIQKWAFPSNGKSSKVVQILKFKGQLVIATNGFGLLKFSNNKIIKIPTLNKKFENIVNIQTHVNEMLIGYDEGVLKTKNLKEFSTIRAIQNFFLTDIQITNDELILATYFNGSLSYNLKTFKLSKSNLPTVIEDVKSLFIDSKKSIWYSTNLGLYKKNHKNELTVYNDVNGFPSLKTTTCFEDKNGNIWVGTEGKGLISFPSQKIFFYNRSNGFPSDLITNINQDKSKNLWFSTFDKGIFKRNFKGEFDYVTDLSNISWSSALDVDGANWFGTEEGLIRIFSNKAEFVNDKNLPGVKITSLLKINDHKFILAGDNGLCIYENGKFTKVVSSNNLKIGLVKDIQLFKNKIVCATDRGLYSYEKGMFVNLNQLYDVIYCLAKDNTNLWVGTENGLLLIQKNELKKINLGIEPSSNFILFIQTYHHFVFIGTNNGLFILNSLTNELKHFGKNEGILDLESNVKSSYIDRNGNLWFGTASGTVIFDISTLNLTINKPNLVLSSLLLNQENFNYSKYSKSLNTNGLPANLRLPFTKNNLTINLDAIQFENHKDIYYQYWIEGLDEKWSPESKNSSISLTSLPHGDFILHFRAIIGKDLFSKEIIIPLSIRPPFYKTWWFFLIAVIFAFGIIYLIVQIRLKRERQRNYNETLEFKSRLMVLEQKSLNASMNRHFIFNSLNSIQYFINSQDRISANRYLTNFAKLIRKNLDSTVEAGSMIPLSLELEGLELYLSLEAMRFKDRFEYEINIDNIDTESIKVPSMMLQPFVENSIIHGILPNETVKGKIKIDIKAEGNILIIQLDDNGVGIDKSVGSKKSEKGDQKSQGMEITSKRIDLIKKLSNQRFELIGPFQVTDENRTINGTRVLLKIPFENFEY
jgi:sensor histidine kinase YesM